MNRYRLVPVVVALVAASWGCAFDLDAQGIAASGGFERQLAVSGPVTLEVRTGSGSIEIRRGADTEVRVIGRIRANRAWNNLSAQERVRLIENNPPIVQNGNAIRIGEFADRDLGRNISISYQLMVPAATRVVSRTGSGSHRIDSLSGPVEAHTGSGSIHVGQIGGSVTAVSGSGSIDVLGATQGLTATTGSGSVSAQNVTGSVDARSGSGRLTIAYAGAGGGSFSTGSGSIDVTGADGSLRAHAGSGSIRIDGRPSGDWSIETGSGGVSLRLPPDAAFDVSARTGSGSIQTNHPIEVRGTFSRRQLEGRVRGGGPRLNVSASSGSIRLD